MIPLVLELLGGAGHDRDADDIPGVQAVLFGVVGFGQGAEDLLGAPDEEFDPALGIASGAGHLFGVTGGVMEAALRTAVETLTGKELAT